MLVVPFLLCRLPSLRYFVTRGNTTHMSSLSFPFHIVCDGLWERMLTAQPEQLVHAMRAAGLDDPAVLIGYPREQLGGCAGNGTSINYRGTFCIDGGRRPKDRPYFYGYCYLYCYSWMSMVL